MRYFGCGTGAYGGYNVMHGMGSYGGWFMGIGLVVIIGIIALLFYTLAHNKKKETGSKSEAADILARRFAAGEISAEEYSRMKELIR